MTGAVTVSPLNCTGSEPNLQSCRSPVSVLNNCSSGLVVELECAGEPGNQHHFANYMHSVCIQF